MKKSKSWNYVKCSNHWIKIYFCENSPFAIGNKKWHVVRMGKLYHLLLWTYMWLFFFKFGYLTKVSNCLNHNLYIRNVNIIAKETSKLQFVYYLTQQTITAGNHVEVKFAINKRTKQWTKEYKSRPEAEVNPVVVNYLFTFKYGMNVTFLGSWLLWYK